MVLRHDFEDPTKDQVAVFGAVAPIIERSFKKASAWADTRPNEITFNCGHIDSTDPYKQMCYPPDEQKLFALASRLVALSKNQNSKITFSIWCEDIGGAIPMGIVATW